MKTKPKQEQRPEGKLIFNGKEVDFKTGLTFDEKVEVFCFCALVSGIIILGFLLFVNFFLFPKC